MVGMASSDARHGRNRARGGGRFFKWVAAGRVIRAQLVSQLIRVQLVLLD